jgi:hypothetical protein
LWQQAKEWLSTSEDVKKIGKFIRIIHNGLPLLATGPLDGKCTDDDLEDKFITYQYLEKTQHYLQRKQVTMRKKTILTTRRSTLRRATN